MATKMKPGDIARVGSQEPDEDPDEIAAFAALDPREAARMRRRDHDAGAESRALMRTGQAKTFKQILDAQAKAGRLAAKPGHLAAERRRPRDEWPG
jgi:hypothetical protein